jgi:hypothetical protein
MARESAAISAHRGVAAGVAGKRRRCNESFRVVTNSEQTGAETMVTRLFVAIVAVMLGCAAQAQPTKPISVTASVVGNIRPGETATITWTVREALHKSSS